MKKLFILNSPFQCFLAKNSLSYYPDDFDLIYLAEHPSAEGLHYSKELSQFGSLFKYYDLSKTIDYRSLVDEITSSLGHYNEVIVSRFDLLPQNLLIKKLNYDILSGIDDGTANIFLDSCLFIENRKSLPSDFIPIEEIRKSMSFHYTCYDSENIIQKSQHRYCPLSLQHQSSDMTPVRFFIGQPFEEIFSPSDLIKYRSFFKDKTFDYYIKHPREGNPLFDNTTIFNKNGLIAEEAILELCKDKPFELIGNLSTCMYNLSTLASSITAFVSNDTQHQRIELANEFGFNVVKFSLDD